MRKSWGIAVTVFAVLAGGGVGEEETVASEVVGGARTGMGGIELSEAEMGIALDCDDDDASLVLAILL